jgi:hypothetical protein
MFELEALIGSRIESFCPETRTEMILGPEAFIESRIETAFRCDGRI